MKSSNFVSIIFFSLPSDVGKKICKHGRYGNSHIKSQQNSYYFCEKSPKYWHSPRQRDSTNFCDMLFETY